MKTEFTDVSETQKTVAIEIESEVVDAEIDRVAQGFKKVKVPGFRPGKVPATIIKRRFRDQILHEVMHGLIPRAVEEALQERGIEPIDTPNVRDVALEEGQPLRFTAAIETVPPFDPGDLSTLTGDPGSRGDHRRRDRANPAAAARTSGEVRTGRGPPVDRRRHGGRRSRSSGCIGPRSSRGRQHRDRVEGQSSRIRCEPRRRRRRRREDVLDPLSRGLHRRGNGRNRRRPTR